MELDHAIATLQTQTRIAASESISSQSRISVIETRRKYGFDSLRSWRSPESRYEIHLITIKLHAFPYSLVETAKANGVVPHAYLERVFAELPLIESHGMFASVRGLCVEPPKRLAPEIDVLCAPTCSSRIRAKLSANKAGPFVRP